MSLSYTTRKVELASRNFHGAQMLPELEQKFHAIEEQRLGLFDRLSRLDESSLRYHPGPESWSMLQVVAHLVLVEQIVLKTMQRGERPMVRRRWWHAIGAWIVSIVMGRGLRVPAPSKKVVPIGDTPLTESKARWDEMRLQLRAFLETTTVESARCLGFRHPVAGPLDVPSSLDFVRTHFDHHMRQIARIESSAAKSGSREIPLPA